MTEEQTDLQQIARGCVPAAMPADMRRRLLDSMLREEAELQADAELEAELTALYAASPMPTALRSRLLQGVKPATEYRGYWWRRAVAAVLVALLVLPLLWWGLRPVPGDVSPMVEMKREILPADMSGPEVRCDTFVMEEIDQSRLVIKVQAAVEPGLPEDVI